MKNTNYFAYATVILTVLLVYLFGELKYEKTMGKTKEMWLLEDAEELQVEIDSMNVTIQTLAKQNKEYEIILSIIKLKMAEAREKEEGSKDEKAEPIKQDTMPKRDPNYPGQYIPRGQQSPNRGSLTI